MQAEGENPYPAAPPAIAGGCTPDGCRPLPKPYRRLPRAQARNPACRRMCRRPPRAPASEPAWRAGYFGLGRSPPPTPQDAPFNCQNADAPGGRDGGGDSHPERPGCQKAETDGQPPGGESAPRCRGEIRLPARARLRASPQGKRAYARPTVGSSAAWRLTRRAQQSPKRYKTKTGINRSLDSHVRCSDLLGRAGSAHRINTALELRLADLLEHPPDFLPALFYQSSPAYGHPQLPRPLLVYRDII